MSACDRATVDLAGDADVAFSPPKPKSVPTSMADQEKAWGQSSEVPAWKWGSPMSVTYDIKGGFHS